jgi:hypothetical protein
MAPDGTGSVTFAFSKVYFGDTDRNGTPDAPFGWKQYGYDIDGKITTDTFVDLCQPLFNASPHLVFPDGDGGIDNSFGRNILPILLGVQSNFTLVVNTGILQGKQTFMLDLEDLGSGSSYNPLLSRLYPGANLGATPHFDGTDAWPARRSPSASASTRRA